MYEVNVASIFLSVFHKIEKISKHISIHFVVRIHWFINSNSCVDDDGKKMVQISEATSWFYHSPALISNPDTNGSFCSLACCDIGMSGGIAGDLNDCYNVSTGYCSSVSNSAGLPDTCTPDKVMPNAKMIVG